MVPGTRTKNNLFYMALTLLALASAGVGPAPPPVGEQWLIEQTRGNLGYLTKRIDAGNTT